jgi:tRNA threonylcarbamoyladenosine biosynthesis protein TsaE
MSLPWEERTLGPDGTQGLGERLAGQLTGAPVIHLRGELGAGKTCFARGLAQGLGADPDQVHSPSYSLVHLYRDPAGHAVLYHVDLYRASGEMDLREIGLEEVLSEKIVTAIEWPERLSGIYDRPAPDLEVHLEILGPEERRVTVSCP